jgi:hypothetical protein
MLFLGQQVNTIGYCLAQNLPDAKWISVNCSLSKPFICEYAPIQQTETPTCPTAPVPTAPSVSTAPSCPNCPTCPAPTTVACPDCPTCSAPTFSIPTCPTLSNTYPCPSDDWYYSHITRKCYYFGAGGINWDAANANCANQHATLVSIHSAKENNIIDGNNQGCRDPEIGISR